MLFTHTVTLLWVHSHGCGDLLVEYKLPLCKLKHSVGGVGPAPPCVMRDESHHSLCYVPFLYKEQHVLAMVSSNYSFPIWASCFIP